WNGCWTAASPTNAAPPCTGNCWTPSASGLWPAGWPNAVSSASCCSRCAARGCWTPGWARASRRPIGQRCVSGWKPCSRPSSRAADSLHHAQFRFRLRWRRRGAHAVAGDDLAHLLQQLVGLFAGKVLVVALLQAVGAEHHVHVGGHAVLL